MSKERGYEQACMIVGDSECRIHPICGATKAELTRLRASVERLEKERDKTERELSDEKQKVKNLEEYMLKGVAFRDELQARIKELEGRLCRARGILDRLLTKESWNVDAVKAALSQIGPCPHEADAARLREALEWTDSMAASDKAGDALGWWIWGNVSRDMSPRVILRKFLAELKRREEEG